MKIPLTLPLWMIERIVEILREHPYTGCDDIIREIKKQVEAHGST